MKLGGNVNGKTDLYGILKAPRLTDDLKIDSLNFNDIYIGTLTDTSSYNNESNKVNVFTRRMMADGSETFKLTGNLDLKEKEIDLGCKDGRE